ncbi:MAG: hypothetical protein ACKVJK_02030 [Methylophagaceae bacterium]|jgi:hypothetical protein|tara:strand:+ start:889 stop:1407 length:519 start_codon:yes stop_codon:yes gene_type:complete
MKRDYETGVSDTPIFFTGVEVEKTPAFDMKTLFVTDVQNYNEIMKHYTNEQCEHIFFGANHSYNPVTSDNFEDWDLMIRAFTDQGILCSLDIPSTINLEWFLDGGLVESDYFIPQLRVVVPYIKQWGYNAMIKIDDKDFKASNPGVWCHSLHDLMDREKFTDWSKYSLDKPL